MPIYLRRIIFWLFVVTFTITGPLLVLYTAGYRLNWQNGHVIRTGVISISSVPRHATVWLDGEDTRQKTPHVFKQLLPHEYTVRLEKDNYIPWEGTVQVDSGQTVSLQNILLYLDAPSETLFDTHIQALSVNPSGSMIAYLTQQAGWNELWLYDLVLQEHQLISQSVTVLDADELQLLWSSDGGYLVLFETNVGPRLYTAAGDPLQIDLPALPVTRVAWHPSNNHLLYLSTSSGLVQYDLSRGSSTLLEQTDKQSIQLDASILTFADNGDQTEVQQIIGKDKRVLALLDSGNYELVMRDRSFLLLQNDHEEIFLLDIDAQEPILLERAATSFDWLASQHLLVFSDGSEVNVYNANTHEITFLTRQSLVIESVLWHPVGQHLIVQDTADIQAYEYNAAANDRAVTTLLDDIEVVQWWMDDAGETLYVYGLKDGAYGIYRRPLMKDTLSFEL